MLNMKAPQEPGGNPQNLDLESLQQTSTTHPQVQAEPLVNMGNLTRLLLVAGGFLGTEDSCLFEPHW